MSRGGIGSASIVLVFAVLCLTIFTVITLVPALTEEILIDSEVRLVKDFYAADTLAEQVLAEILASSYTPESVMGVEITSYWCWDTFTELVYFVSPISDTKELYVVVSIDFESYSILTWRMTEIGEWDSDRPLNVWQGDEDFLGSW